MENPRLLLLIWGNQLFGHKIVWDYLKVLGFKTFYSTDGQLLLTAIIFIWSNHSDSHRLPTCEAVFSLGGFSFLFWSMVFCSPGWPLDLRVAEDDLELMMFCWVLKLQFCIASPKSSSAEDAVPGIVCAKQAFHPLHYTPNLSSLINLLVLVFAHWSQEFLFSSILVILFFMLPFRVKCRGVHWLT